MGYAVLIKEETALREKELGELRLAPGGKREAVYPEEMRRRRIEGRYYFRPLGGQSQADKVLDVNSFLDKLTRKYAGKRVLVVAHNSTIHAFKEIFGNLTPEQVKALPNTPNCSVNIFEIDKRERPSGKMKLKQEDLILHSQR